MDALLNETLPRPHLTGHARAPRRVVRALSARKVGHRPKWRVWLTTQIAAYRLGLVLGYLALIWFAATAIIAGIPVFRITAPESWTPLWAGALAVGGFIAAIGSLRAGEDRALRITRVFNNIELIGAILVTITLMAYAGSLLWVAFVEGSISRQSVGSGFTALLVPNLVRMVYLLVQLGKKVGS